MRPIATISTVALHAPYVALVGRRRAGDGPLLSVAR
jgi:hypothetical protein